MPKSIRKLEKMFILGIKQMQDPYYQGFAAQVAFYLFLSIVPTMILITQLLGVFNISLDGAILLIEEYTGKQMPAMFNALFEFSSVGFGNIIFAAIALWAGSRASFAIMRITNYTMTDGKSTGRNYFIERFRAIKTMLITILTIVFSIVILVYGDLILDAIINIIGLDQSPISDTLWRFVRWGMGLLLYFLMVSYNYWIMPSVRVTFKSVLPGSILASIGLLVVTMGYSIYASSLANYDVLYGALSSVIALLMWFFLISWVLFFGVLCNKVWFESDEAEETVAKYISRLPAIWRRIRRRIAVTEAEIRRMRR